MAKRRLTIWIALWLAVCSGWAAEHPDWTTPIAPFRIADNLYYVGSKDLASYLVVTRQGDILINSSLESSPELIQKSVEQLGFHVHDIRVLLISHAHFDHDAGSAKIKRLTGAQYMVMDGDVAVVESGGAKDFQYPHDLYPAVKVDRVLHDGDQVRLGGAVLVAHKTPGHTRGCTTWTMRAPLQGPHARRRDCGQLECELRVSPGGPPGQASVVSRNCDRLRAHVRGVARTPMRHLPGGARRLFRDAGEDAAGAGWSGAKRLD